MIARPKIRRNERKTTETGAFEVGNFAPFCCPGQKVVARLRGKLFGAMLAQDVAWFDDRRVGDLLNRLSSDTTKLQAAATETVSLALRSALSAVVSLGLLFLTSWRLTLVALSVVPFMTMVTMVCVSVIKRLATRYQAALADAGAVAQEVLSNLRVVRSFGAEDYEVRRYRRAVGDPDARGGSEKPAALGVGLEQAAVQALFITMTAAFGYASVLGVWYYGGLLVIRGDLTTGELVAFVMLLLAITTSLSVLAQTGAGVMEALGASVEVFAIIDHPSGIPNRTGAAPTRAVAAALASDDAASCEFRDVVFAYAARPGVEVLRGASLVVPARTRAAFVGASGGGKTTLLHLLARFYDVSGGSVRFDGVDVADFEPAELRVKLALVAQVPALFSGSIADNVAYSALVRGAPRPDMDAVVAAAKAANAHVFTQAFPDGYDSLVGERGVRLSGGQTQRVCIARALLAKPRILLFDEATSALDAESEAVVQAAIDELCVGRTSLTVAHRLSTIVHSDVIALVANGVVLRAGAHDALLADCPEYADLVRKQLSAKAAS
jgi:ATP-binding cassette subfamily B protein